MSADAALRTLPDLLITPARPGEYLICNPFTRTFALGDTRFVELLSFLLQERSPSELERYEPAECMVLDVSRPLFADGLLGDPTGLDRTRNLDGAAAVKVDRALALARRLRLVIDDESAYADYLAGAKRSPIDARHRGNMHQLVGEYVIRSLRRRGVDEWWVDQKFTPDRTLPREGLYLDVQWRFATSYYTRARLEGKRVLDFGCGPGLFSRLFAGGGATVVGLDTSAEHLETARRLAAEDGLADRVEFRTLELPVERSLAELASQRFDLIFLSDVMMFYFHPYPPDLELDPMALLCGLEKLLAPRGRITVLEPNGAFWQQPWLGDPGRPFTVLTEYRHRRYGVTPTLEQMSRAAESAGLAIAKVRELAPGDECPDTRAAGFAAEFPVWWFFELCRVPQG